MSNDPIRDAIRRAQRALSNELGVTPESLQRAILDGVGEIAGVIITDNREPERGPFVFYAADPVEITPEQREQMITQAMASDSRLTRETAAAAIDAASTDTLALSTEYQVAMRQAETGFDHDVLHLSIKRIDREPIRDWRVLQQIKNAIVGEECEAFELYPAESRLVDTANQYHLWVFTDPNVRVPVGFVHRLVDTMPVGKSQQRKFAAPDALMPSKAQLGDSLRKLCTWMRDNTGPSDGTMEILIEAKALLDQIDKAQKIAQEQRVAIVTGILNVREAVLPQELREQIARVGVEKIIEAAEIQNKWVFSDAECNRRRLAELRRIIADDPALDSVSDAGEFREELEALQAWELASEDSPITLESHIRRLSCALDHVTLAQNILDPIACGKGSTFGAHDVAKQCDEHLQETRDALSGLLGGIQKLTGDKS